MPTARRSSHRPPGDLAVATAGLLAEDRWDLPSDDPKPTSADGAGSSSANSAPSSFGRPGEGARPSARPAMSTMTLAAPSAMGRPAASANGARTGESTPTRPLGALSTDAAARVLMPKPPAPDPLRSTMDIRAGALGALALGPSGAARTASAPQPRAPSSAGVPSTPPPSGAAPSDPPMPLTSRVPVGTLALGPAMAPRTASATVPAIAPPARSLQSAGTLVANVAPVPPPPASRLETITDAQPPPPDRSATAPRLELAPSQPPARTASDGATTTPTSSTKAVTVPLRPAGGADGTAQRTASSATASPSPSHGVPASNTTTQRQRLVLASEVLREDLVPHEPESQAMRWVLGVAGVVLVATAALELVRGPHALSAWAIPGVTALVVAASPMRYATRALLGFAPALPAFAVQALALPGSSPPGALLFTAVCSLLPAALLFRANFRASRRARGFVGFGLLFALAWLLVPGGGGVLGGSAGSAGWALAHLGAIGGLAVMLLSSLAFMGTNTSAGCRAWAALAVAWSGLVVLSAGAVHGGDFEPGLWPAVAAASVAALAATMAVSVAGLLAVYARPSEPRTGIGVAATHHPRSGSGTSSG